MNRPNQQHWVLLGFLCTSWGLAFYLIAVALESFPPLTLVSIRLLVGALILYGLMRWQGQSLPREPRWWWYFVLLSIMGNLIPFTLISWGEMRIPSSQAGLLMALMPISTMVLAHFFVPHEGLTPLRIVGALMGFAGVAVMVGDDVLSGWGGGALLGQVAVIAATFSYAVNTVFAKRLPALPGLAMATGSLIVGTLILWPIALLVEQPWQLEVVPSSWAAVFTLGVFSTGLATWVYFELVSDCGPSFVAITNYVIPAISFIAGVLLLAEPAALSQLTGLIAVFIGIAISRPKRPRVAAS